MLREVHMLLPGAAEVPAGEIVASIKATPGYGSLTSSCLVV
jgi:hypothetical protein